MAWKSPWISSSSLPFLRVVPPSSDTMKRVVSTYTR
jgi:hypothetical protein